MGGTTTAAARAARAKMAVQAVFSFPCRPLAAMAVNCAMQARRLRCNVIAGAVGAALRR